MELDGSIGEGGGQVLRTALAFSCVLGKPLGIKKIRAGRPKPGLKNQHLACVKALQEMSGAQVKGAELGSQELVFAPGEIKGGKYVFDIGTAGSVTLLLQALLPVAAFADAETRFTLVGGTDVAWSPPHLYTEKVLLPALTKMGLKVEMETKKWGFFPAGGGSVGVTVTPVKGLHGIELVERGALTSLSGWSVCSNLPESVAERQKAAVLKLLAGKGIEGKIGVEVVESLDKGSELFLLAEYDGVVAGFSSLGARGKPAEQVGEEAARQFLEFHGSGACVDAHLADQLMVWMALAEGKSRFKAGKLSSHALTNRQVIGELGGAEFVAGNGFVEVEGLGRALKLG